MSFNQHRAEALRQAIEQTTQSLLKVNNNGGSASTQAAKLFQTHIEKLQEAELALLTDASDDEGDTSTSLAHAPSLNSAVEAFESLRRATAALSGNSTEVSTPWYPDDSGEWIEVHYDRTTCPCRGLQSVEILSAGERKNKKWHSLPNFAMEFAWDTHLDSDARIVAYKVVK